MDKIQFWVNDQEHTVSDVSTNLTLLNYLRYHADLPGTKEGCAEGDCGACSVVLVENEDGKNAFRAVNSCLLFLPAVHGRRVYTVEGLSDQNNLHPVQDAMVRKLGSQCGYCTPGFIMTLFEACYREDMEGPWQLDDQLCGNLCRCTGYRPIREAGAEISGWKVRRSFLGRFGPGMNASLALIRPRRGHFWHPCLLKRFLSCVANTQMHIAGATDLALDVTKFHRPLPKLISLEGLHRLKHLAHDGNGWSIGAGVTLSRLETAVANRLPALENMLRYFASRQIKNRATVGGNLVNASPIGDLAPVFLALDAQMVVRSAQGQRQIPCDEFFLDYRKTALQPEEILESIFVPDSDAYVNAYKVSKRKEMDISAVAAGLSLVRDKDGKITQARFGFGGMAATPKRATTAEKAVTGRKLTTATVRKAMDAIDDDFTPLSDHRGTSWYRQKVAKNFLLGFFDEVLKSPKPASLRAGGLAHPEVRP